MSPPEVYLTKQYQEPLVPRQALKWFENTAFTWKGILSDELLSGIKRVLLGALETSQPLSQVLESLDRVFSPYIGNTSALPDQEQKQPYRLETLVRTVSTGAYNQGRVATFDGDPFIVGYRYSAVLDSRTTPVCKFLHGKVLQAGSTLLERLTPPRHHNCRSILIPVTQNQPPQTFLTETEAAQAVEMSGRDFAEQDQIVRVYGNCSMRLQGGPAWEALEVLCSR